MYCQARSLLSMGIQCRYVLLIQLLFFVTVLHPCRALTSQLHASVGALNHKFFVLFIFYTLLTSLQAMMLIVTRMVRCGWELDEDSSDQAVPSAGDTAEEWDAQDEPSAPDEEGLLDPTRMMNFHSKYVYEGCDNLYDYNLVLILLVASIVFLVFTCGMLIENIESIESNTGKIARMKLRVGKGGTELSRVTSQFNEMFGTSDLSSLLLSQLKYISPLS